MRAFKAKAWVRLAALLAPLTGMAASDSSCQFETPVGDFFFDSDDNDSFFDDLEDLFD